MRAERVIFRKWKGNGGIIAFFPDQKDGPYIGSYEHVGQHGNASYPHPQTEPAEPHEYAALLKELLGIYDYIKVVRRA